MKTKERTTNDLRRTIFYDDYGRIVCYMDERINSIRVCTGKPSDVSCISWKYDKNERTIAERTAIEFYNNWVNR